jgi:hypothetical protein
MLCIRLDNRLSFPDRYSLRSPCDTGRNRVPPTRTTHTPNRIAKAVEYSEHTRDIKNASYQHAVGASGLGRTALP